MIEKTILRELCVSDGISIAEIARNTGTSVPTVTKYLERLGCKGMVESCGRTVTSHGRQPNLFKVRSDSAYFLGVDPKHDTLMLALMDISGKTVSERQEKLDFANTPEMMETVCSECERFISDSGIDRRRIHSAAFNISGRVNPETGDSHSIFNFENDDRPLGETLSARLGFKVLIDNDTRLMAYADLMSRDKMSDFRNYLFINMGWGIGLSIIINGSIYYGMNGFSGEFGHTYVYDNEIMCHCGKKGCLETEVSGRAICSHLAERVRGGETSILGKKIRRSDQLSENDVIQAALRDDTLSIEVIEKAGAELGRQIANLINIFNPEAVIIGGSMQDAGDCFIEPVKLAVRRYSLRLMSQNVAILPSLLGDRGGCIGACLKARDRMLEEI